MASSKEYLTFVLEQLSHLDGITHRTMMGEFILYYRGKLVGGIYDDRLLVKPVKAALALMPLPPVSSRMMAPKKCCRSRMWTTERF